MSRALQDAQITEEEQEGSGGGEKGVRTWRTERGEINKVMRSGRGCRFASPTEDMIPQLFSLKCSRVYKAAPGGGSVSIPLS